MNGWRTYLVVLAVLLMLSATTYTIIHTNKVIENNRLLNQAQVPHTISAKATDAMVFMCINKPPVINISDCTATQINQSTPLENNTYFCQINAYDPDGEPGFTYSYTAISQEGVNFSINSTGGVRIWGNQTGLGYYSTEITVRDNSTCPLSSSEIYAFQIIDVNDPPYLKALMPSRTITAGTTASAYYLNDYFADWDDPYLNYTVSATSNIQVTIDQNTSEVKIYSPDTFCDSETIYFTAIDKGNLTADSNMVQILSQCATKTPSTSGTSSSSSSICRPEWQCKDWSACLPNSTRYRDCVDLHGCDIDNLLQTFWESCEYVPTCFDGVQNQGETGVDCGGPCPACQPQATCFDGVQNQGETGVDCGGPCPACNVAPTCFDGIQNQNETGVDCGGPCAACKELQVPALISTNSGLGVGTAIAVGISIIGIALFYLLFRKEIKKTLARIGWWFTRKQRKQILISDSDKLAIMDALKKIEHSISLSRKKREFRSDEKIVQKLVQQNRTYLSKALALPIEFTPQEMTEKANKVILQDSLKNVFSLFMKKQSVLETKKVTLSRFHLSTLLEELRLLILVTSKTSKADYNFIARESSVEGDSFSKMVHLMYNAVLALQFIEVDKAKERYLNMLNIYETLSEKQKFVVYDDLAKIYNYIKYELSWSKGK